MRSNVACLCLLALAAAPCCLAQESSKAIPSLSSEAVSQFNWRSIGPANMGGRITSIAVYEKDPNRWWASTASGGLLKTINNGITFEHQFDSEVTVSIGDVQVSQSNPDILWVGTGEGNPRNSVSWGNGVYKSIDGGKTWKNMGLNKIFQTGRIAIHPTDPDIVYIGALGRLWGPSEDRGLYKTEDGGKTWEKILYVDDKTGIIDVQMNQRNPDTLLVATYVRKRDGFDGNDPEVKFGEGAGIYRTTDGGRTFEKMSIGLPQVKMGRIGLSIYRKNPKIIYAVVETEKIGEAPEKFPYVGFSGESAEVGAKITQISRNTAASKARLKVDDIVVSVDGKSVYDYNELQKAIRAKQSGDNSTWDVRRGGETIKLELTYGEREKPSAEQSERESRMRRNPRSPFSASLGGQLQNLQGQQGSDEKNYGGVYQSKDGGVTWKRINSVNPRPMYYSQIRVDPSDNSYIYVLGTSLYRTKDGGEVFTGDGASSDVHVDHHALWVDPRDGRHMILGNDGGLYVTYDRMENWDHHNHVAIGQFYHVGISSDDNYYAYGGLQDNGSWGGPTRVRDTSGPMNSDWYRVGSGDGFVTLVDPKDPKQIYFESQNGGMGRIHLETGERGFIQPRPPRGTRYRFNWKTPYILSPHNSEIHYSAGNHVFKSVRKGDRTRAISPEFTLTDKGAGSAISESPRVAGVLYVGSTDGALWMTKDDGKSWVNLRDEKSIEESKKSDKATSSRSFANSLGSGRTAQTGSGRRPSGTIASRMSQLLERLDRNKDGFIGKDELPANMRPMLQRFDKNEDGKLAKDELPQTRSVQDSMPEGVGPKKTEAQPAAAGKPKADPRIGEKAEPKKTQAKKREAHKETASGDEKSTKPSKEKNGTGKKKQGKAPESNPDKPAADKPRVEKSQRANMTEATNAEVKKPVAKKSAQEKPAQEKPTVKKAESKDSKAMEMAKEKPKKPVEEKASEENPSKDDKVSGTYEGAFTGSNIPGDSSLEIVLKLQADNSLKGTYSTARSDGDIDGGEYNPGTGEVNFSAASETANLDFKAKLSGSMMTGVIEINGGSFSIEFEVKRSAPGVNGPEEAGPKTSPLSELVPEPRWVSSLTASKFSDSRCYVTFDGHRSNDDEPYLFVSEDYGASWRSIRANLPSLAGSTRVLREDIENENVLYLGCEFSIWVSIDRGESWTKLNSNLPTVAVHEIAQHPTRGEIVAGTHGRSLWVADVSALRQLSKETLAAAVTLYEPQKVIRWRSTVRRGSSGTRQFVGENPDSGAKIYYSLARNVRSAKLEITSLLGETLLDRDVATSAGLHVESWDLRSSGRSRRSSSTGEYLVTLTVDGQVQKQKLSVVDDPEFASSARAEDELEFWEHFLGLLQEESYEGKELIEQ